MRVPAAAVAASLVSVLLGVGAGAQPLLDRADAALVRVVVETASGRSYGSGFFVDERHVVTNHHVVRPGLPPAGSARLFVIPHDAETEAPVEVVGHDARSDLAVLRYAGEGSHAALPLAATTPAPLTRVFAMGYPVAVSSVAMGSLPSSRGLGVLSNDPYYGQLGADLGLVRLLQHDAAINPGNSGGPLIDDCGRVLGVNTGTGLTEVRGTIADGGSLQLSDRDSDDVVVTIPAQGIFYAVDVSELTALLDELNVDYGRAPACGGGAATPRARRPPLLTSLFAAIASALLLAAAYLAARRRRVPRAAAAGAPAARRWGREWSVAMMALPMLAFAVVFAPGFRDDADDRLDRTFSRVLGRDWSASRTDENGWTDLHYAAAFNLPETARRLLDAGAPVDATLLVDREFLSERLIDTLGGIAVVWRRLGQTPLHVAAQFDSPGVIGVLVDRGADVAAKTLEGDEAMHVAANAGAFRAVEVLMELSGDVSARNVEGEVPLLRAAAGTLGTRVPLLNRLLDAGADVNARDIKGETALHKAARYRGNRMILEVRMDRGADVGAVDDEGATALHVAAGRRRVDNVRQLLSRGADVHAKDHYGHTALLVAVNGALEVVKLLLEYGASALDVDEYGGTTLHHVAWGGRGQGRVVELLLERGIGVDATDQFGDTPLHLAAAWGNFDIVRTMLEAGADADARNYRGETPLHRAAEYVGYPPGVPVVAALIDHGADVNARNADGDMPLHVALKSDPHTVSLLVRRGADIGARGGEGLTPLELTRFSAFADDSSVSIKRAMLLRELGMVGELEAMPPEIFVFVGEMYTAVPYVSDWSTYVPADPALAAEWYRRAAVRGHVGAQWRLGMMHRPGSGALSDPVTAHMWLSIAALNDDVEGWALEGRQRIAEGMTPAQVAEAMSRTAACVQSNYQDCG